MAQEKRSRLQLLNQVDDPLNILTGIIERHGILLGKLIHEVGLGNVLYGIESPDTDVTTHAASASAHHVKYTDANAVDAVHDKYLDADAIAAVPFIEYIPFGSEPITGQSYAP